MSLVQKHISSKIRWQTTFDDKLLAPNLLAKLSSWTSHKLPGTLDHVYSNMCPEDQNWKIDSIELNLGQTSYGTLTSDLNKRVMKALKEELRKLLLYSANSESKIEITDLKKTRLQLLERFLLKGCVSFEGLKDDSSIGKVFQELLRSSLSQTIQLIRRLGVKEEVRRRIAWQIEEKTIIELIHGLEPNYGEFVIDFTIELETVRKSEASIEAPPSQFKKETWYWVLTHLLVERGTIFNKAAFIESTLQKMAARYNMSFDQIFTLFERAAFNSSQHSKIELDLIKAVRMISDRSGKKALPGKGQSKHWKELQTILARQLWNKRNEQLRLNELIYQLVGEDKARLQQVIVQLRWDKATWVAFSKNIRKTTLDQIASAYSGTQGQLISQWRGMLLSAKNRLNEVSEQTIDLIIIKYLLTHQSSEKNLSMFIEYVLESLYRSTSHTKAELLNYLMEEIEHVTYSYVFTAEYNTMKDLLIREMSETTTHQFGSQFTELLNALLESYINPEISMERSALESRFPRAIQMFPEATLAILRRFSDHTLLMSLLQSILDRSTFDKLTKAGSTAFHKIIHSFSQLLANGCPGGTMPEEWYTLNEWASFQAARVVIEKEDAELAVLTEDWLTGMEVYVSNPEIVYFLIEASFDHPLSKRLLEKFNASEVLDTPTADWLRRSLDEKNYAPRVILFYLRKLDLGLQLDIISQLETKERKILFEYLLPGSYELWLAYYENGSLNPHLISAVDGRSKFDIKLSEFWRMLSEIVALNRPKNELQNNLNKSGWLLSESDSNLNPSILNWSGWMLDKTLEDKEIFKDPVSDPYGFVAQFANSNISDEIKSELQSAFDLDSLCMYITSALDSESYEQIITIRSLYLGVNEITQPEIVTQLRTKLWEAFWQVLTPEQSPTPVLIEVMQEMVTKLPNERYEDEASFRSILTSGNMTIPRFLEMLILKVNPQWTDGVNRTNQKVQDPVWETARNKQMLEIMLMDRLSPNETNAWIPGFFETSSESMIHSITKAHPAVLYRAIAFRFKTRKQRRQIISSVPMQTVIHAMIELNISKRTSLRGVSQLYEVIVSSESNAVLNNMLADSIYSTVLDIWIDDVWDMLMPSKFLPEILWKVNREHGIASDETLDGLFELRELLPERFVPVLDALTRERRPVSVKQEFDEPEHEINEIPKLKTMNDEKESISVRNAGLVLLSTYVPLLFERLGIVKEGEFVNEQASLDAVHYLQYLGTGLTHTEEVYLPLNKLLCGLSIETPVPQGIEISEENKTLITGLLEAAISHWPAIGNSSVDGFRGNWIVRDGLLTEEEDRWQLQVEKKAYDLLINQSPYSFSIIRFPWMNKPIHVSWPY